MIDLQQLLTTIDELPPDMLLKVREYVEKRAQTLIFTLSSEQLSAIDTAFRAVQTEAATMSETEINTVIDEAIAEVRNDRKNPRHS